MSRLTKNNDTQYDFIGKYNSNIDEFRFNKELRNNVLNKLGELEDLEEQLGFKLTDIKEVSENSFYVTSCKKIHFNGDDFYGDYTPEELKQLIKNILGEYLRCMREVKK